MKKIQKMLKSESGMTLVEIVAAIVIIVMLFAGIFALISVSATTIFVSGQDTRANADGRTRTDNILAGGLAPGMQVVEADDEGFLVSYTVTDADITWNDGTPTMTTSAVPGGVIDATVTVPAADGREIRFRVFGTPEPPSGP